MCFPKYRGIFSVWYEFLNVKATNNGILSITINKIMPSVGEVATLWGFVPIVLATLTNKILPSLQSNNYLWYLRRTSFSLERKRLYLCTLICPSWTPISGMMFFGIKHQRTLWRTASFMHDHTMAWEFVGVET